MFYTLLFVVSALVFVNADIVKFRDCGTIDGTINSVDITPCPHFPCRLQHGKNISMSVNFTPKVDSNTFNTTVHGHILFVDVPYPVPHGKLSGPIQAGVPITYSNVLYVQPIFPKISLSVKWEVRDSNGKDLICFVVPVQITS